MLAGFTWLSKKTTLYQLIVNCRADRGGGGGWLDKLKYMQAAHKNYKLGWLQSRSLVQGSDGSFLFTRMEFFHQNIETESCPISSSKWKFLVCSIQSQTVSGRERGERGGETFWFLILTKVGSEVKSRPRELFEILQFWTFKYFTRENQEKIFIIISPAWSWWRWKPWGNLNVGRGEQPWSRQPPNDEDSGRVWWRDMTWHDVVTWPQGVIIISQIVTQSLTWRDTSRTLENVSSHFCLGEAENINQSAGQCLWCKYYWENDWLGGDPGWLIIRYSTAAY